LEVVQGARRGFAGEFSELMDHVHVVVIAKIVSNISPCGAGERAIRSSVASNRAMRASSLGLMPTCSTNLRSNWRRLSPARSANAGMRPPPSQIIRFAAAATHAVSV
jgi:hypothetical protein